MDQNHIHNTSSAYLDLFIILVLGCMIIFYIVAVVLSNRNYRKWPPHRTLFWIVGVLSIALALVGPIANQAHLDFKMHMLGHLFLGMLAPLLIALAAPMTLVLRTIKVKFARKITKFLKSYPIRLLSDPSTAALLNIGGLWILYTTDLYAQMHVYTSLYVMIHIHVFLAGYLFTVSMIYIDPVAHRTSFVYRASILIIAFAGHGILSKYLYSNPPNGVPGSDAEIGGMLMYYGGDVIDIMFTFIFCSQWYKAARLRSTNTTTVSLRG